VDFDVQVKKTSKFKSKRARLEMEAEERRLAASRQARKEKAAAKKQARKA
jgi:hypothetical protein